MSALDTLKGQRDKMPDAGTESTYVRWLVHTVYLILCYLIEKDDWQK